MPQMLIAADTVVLQRRSRKVKQMSDLNVNTDQVTNLELSGIETSEEVPLYNFIADSDMVRRAILGQCYREARNSPDTSTQIGAIIVTNTGSVRSQTLSHNGFTDGWDFSDEDLERPRKYTLIEHAERRAIYRAARYGIPLEGATLYSSWAACADCSRAIVESGITKLVRHYPPQDEAVERWLESVQLGDEIMLKGGVDIVDVHGPIFDSFPVLRGGVWFDPSSVDPNTP